jgi:drug/metabolite transporter (DMT)-like permease
MLSERLRADLALVVCAMIWGATFVVIKVALEDVSVIAYIAVRFGLAAVIMAAIYWRAVRALSLREVWAGAQIGIFMFAGYIFQLTGLRWTTPSKAAFVTGMYVVFVPFVLAIVMRRRISIWIWSGALSALAGLYFFSVPPEGLGGLNRGDPIVFGCAVMFAFHMIFISRNVRRFSVASMSFLQVATTAVLATVTLPIAAAAGWEHPKLVWTRYLIFAILATAIGATVICFSLQTWAQKRTSASRAAILLTLEPVFAALTSVIMGSERIGARTFLGATLIFAGILLAEWMGATESQPGEIPA